MTPEYEAIISGIESAAAAVRRAVGDAPPHRFGLAPRPGEWPAMDTLTHVAIVRSLCRRNGVSSAGSAAHGNVPFGILHRTGLQLHDTGNQIG
jgi:hypothetical protein